MNPLRVQRWATCLAVLALAATLAGCSKFSRERYETIYLGQPADSVRRKLGRPDEQDPGRWFYEHARAPYHAAEITFVNGQVSGKRWFVDPPDESPPPAEKR